MLSADPLGDRLGLALERVARATDLQTAWAAHDATLVALHDMHQFVNEQLSAARGLGVERARGEEDVLADGEGPGVHGARRLGGHCVGVDPDAVERRPKLGFHRAPHGNWQRLPAADAPKRVLDGPIRDPRGVVVQLAPVQGRGATLGDAPHRLSDRGRRSRKQRPHGLTARRHRRG